MDLYLPADRDNTSTKKPPKTRSDLEASLDFLNIAIADLERLIDDQQSELVELELEREGIWRDLDGLDDDDADDD